MRYKLFSLTIIVVVSIGFIINIDNSPRSDEILDGIMRLPFNPAPLVGSWFSPGLVHNLEEDYEMSIIGTLIIVPAKEKNQSKES